MFLGFKICKEMEERKKEKKEKKSITFNQIKKKYTNEISPTFIFYYKNDIKTNTWNNYYQR